MKSSSESIPNYWNLSSGINWGSNLFGNSGKNTRGNMALGWDDALFAGAGALTSLITGSQQAKVQREIANANMAATADGIKNGVLAQRDAGKANLALGIFGPIWGSTTGADLDFGRQVLAKRREFAEFMPKESGLAREGARWDLDFKSGPAFKNYTRQENLLNLQSNPTLIADRAAKTGIFGRIAQAPIESLMV
jgi:hypothetical protein